MLTLEPIVLLMRDGLRHTKHGDDYDAVCTIVIDLDTKTARAKGFVSTQFRRGLLRDIKAVLKDRYDVELKYSRPRKLQNAVFETDRQS